METRRSGRKLLAVLLPLIVFAGACFLIGKPLLEHVSDPVALRGRVRSAGAAGTLLFALMIYVQVFLAGIPGGPFQIAAGFVYGTVGGILFYDAVAALAGTTVFLLSKRFGAHFAGRFLPDERRAELARIFSEENAAKLALLIFLIPGMPKDILPYFVGTTDMRLRVWLPIALFGRLPSVALSVLSGSALGAGKVRLFVIYMVLLVLSLAVGGFLWRILRARRARKPEGADGTDK